MIIFSHPQFLSLLFLIPVILFIHIISVRSSKRRAIKFVNFDAIRRINGVEVYSKNLTSLYLTLIIVVLLVFSLSGLGITRQVESGKNSFVLVIDSSRSMGVDDIKPTRLDAAKKAGEDFLGMIPTQTRVGLISFAGSTTIETEVTDKTEDLRSSIKAITLKTSGGTDILNALMTASNLLRLESAKIIILISDGGININSVQEVLNYASKNSIMIYTLGVGTSQGGTDETGAVYKISEDVLKLIAENTGGKYYLISKVDDFYSSLNNIIDTAKKNALFDLTNYLLVIAVILLVLNFFIINNKLRSFP